MPIRNEPHPMMVKYGAKLRGIRMARGKTMAQLAVDCGTPKNKGWISHVERGLVLISVESLHRLASAFGMKAHELMKILEES